MSFSIAETLKWSAKEVNVIVTVVAEYMYQYAIQTITVHTQIKLRIPIAAMMKKHNGLIIEDGVRNDMDD